MSQIDQLIAEAEREIVRLEGRLAGLRAARELVSHPSSISRHRITRRPLVKQTVLDLLQEAGPDGLNAASALSMAATKGMNLDRGSVSSLLSRLKNEGIVNYDGIVYRLAGADRLGSTEGGE